MDYKQIEGLKLAITNLARQGCMIRIPSHGVNGRIIGVGFNPYWTGPMDSKIDKLEVNIRDKSGKVIPFNFFNVVGYDVISNDGQGYDSMKNASLDIHIYSPGKERNEDPVEKVHVDIFTQT